jgi:hypothetical protein
LTPRLIGHRRPLLLSDNGRFTALESFLVRGWSRPYPGVFRPKRTQASHGSPKTADPPNVTPPLWTQPFAG